MGSSLNTVQLVDIHTQRTTFEMVAAHPDSQLSGLSFAGRDTCIFLTCGGQGQLKVWDARTPHSKQPVQSSSGGRGVNNSASGSGGNGVRDQSCGVHGNALSVETAGVRDLSCGDSQPLQQGSASIPSQSAGASANYTIAVSHDSYPSSKCAVASSVGSLELFDLRDLGKPCASCSGLGPADVVRSRFSTSSQESLCVQVSV